MGEKERHPDKSDSVNPQNGILVVGFGIGYQEARKNTIEAIVTHLGRV